MKENPSIIFMGTPEFAVPTMEAVHKKYGLKAVVTVPDKPQGRGLKLMPSPVKAKALELGLPVLQPESLKDKEFIRQIAELEPDIMIVVAFRILPASLYKLSKIGTFNIHASLLPKYRGAAPINWAIMNGDTKTGLTSFLLQDKVDTGDILLQKTIKIPDGSTTGDLYELLMNESTEFAIETCDLLLSGNYLTTNQDNTMATPAPKIFRENCKIDWSFDSKKIRDFIHGVSPIPGAWTQWNGKILKILRAEFSNDGGGNPGEYSIEHDKMIVQCGNGTISLSEIQPEGKKAMKVQDFLKGFRGEMNGRFE
jgi:methionyl-tRNA formyltransferase